MSTPRDPSSDPGDGFGGDDRATPDGAGNGRDRPAPGAPPPLTVAASLVALQGLVLLLLALAEAANVESSRASLGISTAAFFGGYAVILLAAAAGLARRATWARGPALFTQLVGLGLAWNLRDLPLVAVLLAGASVVALIGLVHPDTVAALERRAGDATSGAEDD